MQSPDQIRPLTPDRDNLRRRGGAIRAAPAAPVARKENVPPARTEEQPSPKPAMTDERPVPPNGSGTASAAELSNLSADIAIGRVRVVMLAALEDNKDCDRVAETLISDALRRGLSVVKIDAGSGRTSVEPGLSDLTADRVSFGDVVHRVREGLAEVPWGHLATLERRSMRPITLIEALSDIYEVVLVTTGRIGMTSALPLFAGVPCRLVRVGEGALTIRRCRAPSMMPPIWATRSGSSFSRCHSRPKSPEQAWAHFATPPSRHVPRPCGPRVSRA